MGVEPKIRVPHLAAVCRSQAGFSRFLPGCGLGFATVNSTASAVARRALMIFDDEPLEIRDPAVRLCQAVAAFCCYPASSTNRLLDELPIQVKICSD